MAKKLTDEIIQSRLSGRNIILLDTYVMCHTKIRFKCTKLSCGWVWSALPNNVVSKGRGCPKCGGRIPRPIEEVDAELVKRGISRLSEYVGADSGMEFSGICGHTWRAKYSNVINNGTGCPKCFGSNPLTNSSIDAKLLGRGIKRESEYTGRNSHKMKYSCLCCGNKWSAVVGSVLDGVGCPNCAKTGFNSKKPSVVYVYAINDTHCGFGITNNFKTRADRHKTSFKKHNAYAELITTYECSGIQAQQIERLIQKTFPIVNTGIEGFKKEATHLHNLPAVLNLISNTLDNPI